MVMLLNRMNMMLKKYVVDDADDDEVVKVEYYCLHV